MTDFLAFIRSYIRGDVAVEYNDAFHILDGITPPAE